MKLLLKLGADPTCGGTNAALQTARDRFIYEVLLENGADPTVVQEYELGMSLCVN